MKTYPRSQSACRSTFWYGDEMQIDLVEATARRGARDHLAQVNYSYLHYLLPRFLSGPLEKRSLLRGAGHWNGCGCPGSCLDH